MTDEQLREIYAAHNEPYDGMSFGCFKSAIQDYEAEKAKETCKWLKTVAPDYVISQHWVNGNEFEGTLFGRYTKDLEQYPYCPCGKPIEVVGWVGNVKNV